MNSDLLVGVTIGEGGNTNVQGGIHAIVGLGSTKMVGSNKILSHMFTQQMLGIQYI